MITVWRAFQARNVLAMYNCEGCVWVGGCRGGGVGEGGIKLKINTLINCRFFYVH